MYAFDRVQGIPIDGNKGDPIIDHPDVLRLASTMKSEVEAMRALAIYGGFALDMTKSSQNEYWETKSSLMIPIIKGWLTERSLEITSNAIQIHGSMGLSRRLALRNIIGMQEFYQYMKELLQSGK